MVSTTIDLVMRGFNSLLVPCSNILLQPCHDCLCRRHGFDIIWVGSVIHTLEGGNANYMCRSDMELASWK
jgi:hypothetical protein